MVSRLRLDGLRRPAIVALGCLLAAGFILLLGACRRHQVRPTATAIPTAEPLPFFSRAGQDVITRTPPSRAELSVSVPVSGTNSNVPDALVQPSPDALEKRYPEEITGIGDIVGFGRPIVTYDGARNVATSAYAAYKWNPQGGSFVCDFDDDLQLVLEETVLTGFEYACECCLVMLVRQMPAAEAVSDTYPYRIGATATITPVTIGDSRGEFVAGRWVVTAEEAGQQRLHWQAGDEQWTLRWRTCDWLFEIRTIGQDVDAGFVYEDLVTIAEDIDRQVSCN